MPYSWGVVVVLGFVQRRGENPFSSSLQLSVTGLLGGADYMWRPFYSSSFQPLHPCSESYKFCHDNNPLCIQHSFLGQNYFGNVPYTPTPIPSTPYSRPPPHSRPWAGRGHQLGQRCHSPHLCSGSPLALIPQPDSVPSRSALDITGPERFRVSMAVGSTAWGMGGMNVLVNSWLNALLKKESHLSCF